MMKSLMLKLLSITILLSSLVAAKTIEEKIIKFEKQMIERQLSRMGGELHDVSIALKKDLKQDGWIGYVLDLDFTLQGKKLSQRDTLFSNGKLITRDLIDITSKTSLKNMLYPTLSKEYFSDKHHIAGDKNAKNTLVVFSDPLCPICIDEVPYIIKKILDNPKNVKLYYYHMPLSSHPTATTLAKASILAHEQGIKNVDYKIYTANFPAKYNFNGSQEKDHQKVLNFFNKEFGTKFTMEQINDPRLDKLLEYDQMMADKAFVNGTPTLFFNGEYDMRRSKFEDFL